MAIDFARRLAFVGVWLAPGLILGKAAGALTISPGPISTHEVSALAAFRDTENNDELVRDEDTVFVVAPPPFDETVSVGVVGVLGGVANASATLQTESSLSDRITVTGSVSASLNSAGPPREDAEADALMKPLLSFSVDEVAEYVFSGELQATDPGSFIVAEIELAALLPQLQTIHLVTASGPFSFQGVLQPGDYALLGDVFASTIGAVDSVFASFDYQVVVSEVPEASTVLLLALALLACAYGARTRWPRLDRVVSHEIDSSLL